MAKSSNEDRNLREWKVRDVVEEKKEEKSTTDSSHSSYIEDIVNKAVRAVFKGQQNPDKIIDVLYRMAHEAAINSDTIRDHLLRVNAEAIFSPEQMEIWVELIGTLTDSELL